MEERFDAVILYHNGNVLVVNQAIDNDDEFSIYHSLSIMLNTHECHGYYEFKPTRFSGVYLMYDECAYRDTDIENKNATNVANCDICWNAALVKAKDGHIEVGCDNEINKFTAEELKEILDYIKNK